MNEKMLFLLLVALLLIALILAIKEALPERIIEETEVNTTLIIEPTAVVEHKIYVDETEYKSGNLEVNDEKITVHIPYDEIRLLAKMLWGECRGVPSKMKQAACVWVVLNRVDAGYGDIPAVVTAAGQFTGYRANNPVDEDLTALARDVLIRWYMEKAGLDNVGRVIPSDYLWFAAGGDGNVFRNAYKGGARWNWTMDDPYEEE